MPLFRAPFIWTPQQPIAENWLLASRDLPARDDGKNRWFLFRAKVDLEASPATAPTNITVDGRYILYVNGEEQGRGPVRCSPLAQRYDTHDIAPALRPGRNVVAVLVHTYGVDTAFYEGVRAPGRPPGLRMWRKPTTAWASSKRSMPMPCQPTGQHWTLTMRAGTLPAR
jgi:alpha-L-rhamnosidase